MSTKRNFRQSDFLSNCSELQTEENDSQFCVIVCSTKEELEQLHGKKALDPQYICNLCGRKYSSQSILNVHKIRHKKKDDLPFQCMFCSYKSATKRDLLRHHNQHIGHARQVYKCHLCPKIFKINSSLSEHIKSVHTKETTYRCGKCNFTTERRSTFRIHLDTHDQVQVKIICPFCGSCFRNKSNLKTHLLTHADAKPFGCNQCNQRFTSKNRLIAHQQAVHGPKTFVCKTCEKSFPSIYRLNRHSLIHSGMRPFKCCFCPHTSNTQGNLLKHVRKVHAMFNFTYKDILIERGLKVDPKKNLTHEELRKLVDYGRECSESHLKQLRSKGYTSSSMEQLQQNTYCKKEAQANLIVKMREKPQKVRKPKEGKERKALNKSENKVKGKKEKSTKGISEAVEHSTCEDLILPRMSDSNYILQSNGAIDGLDVLPMTPAIHVIWNVSSDNSAKKSPVSVGKKKRKTSPKFSRKLKERNPKNKSGNVCRSVIAGHDTLPPSPMLEDGDHLTFTDKPPMLNHFSSTNSGLSTTLNNLHDHLVDLEGIEPPNAIVGSNEGINDFDGMCKNLDLYNQLLPMNDEGPFMNAIDCSACKEAGKTTLSKDNLDFKVRDSDVKEKPASSQLVTSGQISTSSSIVQHRSRLKTKSNSKPVSLNESLDVSSPQQLENYKVDPVNVQSKSTKDNSYLSDIFQMAIKHPRDFIDNQMKSANCDQLDGQKGLDLLTPEKVIVLQNNNDQISMKLLPKSQTRKDLYNEPVREIVIKNSISCYWLPNDQLNIMSIAEVEERDRDVVLIIDTLD